MRSPAIRPTFSDGPPGILIGTFYARHFAGNKLGIINSSSNKLNALLRVIDDQYVDTVNMTDLVAHAAFNFSLSIIH
jgi:hypothetical protein